LDEIDEVEEVGPVGVIAEGEGVVGLVLEAGAGVEGPAADHGGDEALAFAEGLLTGGGRGDDEDAAGGFRGDGFPWWEGPAEVLVGAVHGGDGGVDGDGEETAEEHLEFLGFAERVGEEDWGLAGFEGVAAPVDDGGAGVVEGREDVMGLAERAFHDEGVGGDGLGGFGAEAGAEFEVAGVEEGRAVGETGDVDHGAAEDVTCGGEEEAVAGVFPWLVPWESDDVACVVEAVAEETGGGFRADGGGVAGDVVAMGVGDEGEGDGAVGVEPDAGFWEEDAGAAGGDGDRRCGHGVGLRLPNGRKEAMQGEDE
jgi:hypothetical protein